MQALLSSTEQIPAVPEEAGHFPALTLATASELDEIKIMRTRTAETQMRLGKVGVFILGVVLKITEFSLLSSNFWQSRCMEAIPDFLYQN